MTTPRNIDGAEFDWFASDQAGEVALFATGGSGPIPDSVASAIGEHDSVGARLEVSGFGTLSVWQSYSRAGLYAYDWSDSASRYIQVATPTSKPSANVAAAISCIKGLPQLALLFPHALVITPVWQGGA